MVSPPSVDGMVSIPVRLLESALTDAICLRDKARGERGLLAEPGTREADVADAREALWRRTNHGLAALVDWMGGTR
jgi:hypothetical protein